MLSVIGMIEVYEREYRAEVFELEIENVNGRILISGYDGETINLRVEKSWGLLGNEPRVKVRKEGKTLKIFSKPKKGLNIGLGSSKVNFELLIPRKVKVKKAVSVNGPITVEGVEECEAVKTVNGAISLDAGRVGTVKGVNGRIKVKAGKLFGDIKTVNGAIEAQVKSVEGHVKIATVNGSIVLHLHPEINAKLEAETSNGSITSNIEELSVERVSKHHGPKKASLTLGDGTNVLEVRTVNGTINLMKNTKPRPIKL